MSGKGKVGVGEGPAGCPLLYLLLFACCLIPIGMAGGECP